MFDASGDEETPRGERRNQPLAIADSRQVHSRFNWLVMSSILLEQMSFPYLRVIYCERLGSRVGLETVKPGRDFAKFFVL
jgi:hypothetical protein